MNLDAAQHDQRLAAPFSSCDGIDLYEEFSAAYLTRGKELFFQLALYFYGPREPKRIVEIGCGTGDMLRLLSAAFPKAEIIGSDSSEEMARRADGKTRDLSNVTVINASASNFDSYGRSADLVLSHASYRLWDQPAQAVRQIVQGLSAGGVVYISDFCRELPEALVLEISETLDRVDFSQLYVRQWLLSPTLADLKKTLDEANVEYRLGRGGLAGFERSSKEAAKVIASRPELIPVLIALNSGQGIPHPLVSETVFHLVFGAARWPAS